MGEVQKETGDGVFTYVSRDVLAVEAEAGGNIQAVHRLLPIMTLGRSDVDGTWEEDGDIHGDHGSRPARGRDSELAEPTGHCPDGWGSPGLAASTSLEHSSAWGRGPGAS